MVINRHWRKEGKELWTLGCMPGSTWPKDSASYNQPPCATHTLVWLCLWEVWFPVLVKLWFQYAKYNSSKQEKKKKTTPKAKITLTNCYIPEQLNNIEYNTTTATKTQRTKNTGAHILSITKAYNFGHTVYRGCMAQRWDVQEAAEEDSRELGTSVTNLVGTVVEGYMRYQRVRGRQQFPGKRSKFERDSKEKMSGLHYHQLDNQISSEEWAGGQGRHTRVKWNPATFVEWWRAPWVSFRFIECNWKDRVILTGYIGVLLGADPASQHLVAIYWGGKYHPSRGKVVYQNALGKVFR